MASRVYQRGSLFDQLAHAAIAGAGHSFGRDMYSTTRKNFVVIVILALVFAGTAFGFWNMSRGHNRSRTRTFFITFLMNAIIISVSFLLFMIVAVTVFSSNIHFGSTETRAAATSAILNFHVIIVAGSVQFALALMGFFIGRVQRRKRIEAWSIDKHNEQFLLSHGFRDLGGYSNVILDREGNELVLEDFRCDAAAFKVKGRRAVRAKILLDETGRMREYAPA